MPNKPGRPPLDPTDRSVPISFSLPSREFDRVCAAAHAARLTVPDIIRRALRNAANKKRESSNA